MPVCRRTELDPRVLPCTKANSKGIEGFSVKSGTLKLLEENIDSALHDIGVGKDLLPSTLFVQVLRTSVASKLKSFCIAKETTDRSKRRPTEWERIFAHYASDKLLVSRLYKKFKKNRI